MERIYSEKGKDLIVYSNYTYRQVNQLNLMREERWRCTKKDCKDKIFTLDGGNIFSRTENEHNHEPLLDQELNRRSISNAVKRRADEIEVRPSKLIHTEVQTQKKNTIKTLTRKDIKCIRNNFNYTKLKTLPNLPKSSEEIQFAIDSIEIKTIQDEHFLLRNEKEKVIVIFSCDSNLEYLCQNEIVLMDGTFEYAPKHFLQLYTVHGYFEGSYIPLVFCLLKNKKKQSYIDAMRILKECEKRQLHLQPLYIVIDFEQAIHECIVSTFPQTRIVGCRFHLAQAWWRKIQKLGLAATYKDENSDGGKWLHYCFGLTYLRPEEVENAFCDLISIQPADTKLTSFAASILDLIQHVLLHTQTFLSSYKI